MAKKSSKITGVCKNEECSKEFEYVPSSKQKYCSHACYLNNPANKKQRRTSQAYLYRKI